MMWMRSHPTISAALAALIATAALAMPSSAQRVRLFDGRAETPARTATAAEQALLRREIVPVARRLWSGVEMCDAEFQVLDVASGAFTARGAAQRAVLYRYCETGHGFAKGGIVVLQAGRVAAHVTVEDVEPGLLRAVPDLDRDGRAELLIVDGVTHQGETTDGVAILQFPGARGFRSLGAFGIYYGTFGTLDASRYADAWVLYATPGARPTFAAERYRTRDENGRRWTRTSPLRPVRLSPDDTPYRRLR